MMVYTNKQLQAYYTTICVSMFSYNSTKPGGNASLIEPTTPHLNFLNIYKVLPLFFIFNLKF